MIDPQSYILPLPEKVIVSRPAIGTIRLRWPVTAERVQIFSGNKPGTIDLSTPHATVYDTNHVEMTGLNTAVQPAFALRFQGGSWHGRCQLTAERFLPLQGAVNFRDIGGYETVDGRMVAWGKIYRSGLLSQLTPSDLASLQQLNIRLVCDLRSEAEIEKRPDRLPADPALHYLHLPAQNLDRSDQLRGLLAVLFNRTRLESLMDEGYTRIMIEENTELIGAVFRRLADASNLPMIIHCTAGKDRTAVIMALLLSILGVPEETILADYTLSNIHYEKYKAGIDQDLGSLRRLGLSADHIQAVILVRAERLQKMVGYIQQKYGSTEAYLQQIVGVNEEILAMIRHNLLVKPGG